VNDGGVIDRGDQLHATGSWGESVAAHEGSQFVDRVVAKPVSAEALMEQLAELRRTRAPAP